MNNITLEKKKVNSKNMREYIFFYRFLLICVIGISSSFSIYSQEYKFEFGGLLGGASYMGDANRSALLKNINPSIGLVYRYNHNFRWAIKTNLLWAKLSGNTKGLDNSFFYNEQATFSRNLFDMSGQMEFNFFPYSDKYSYESTQRLSPYVFAGIGFSLAPGKTQTFWGPNIPLGLGLKYKIKYRLNLNVEFSFRKLFGDELDTPDKANKLLDNPYNISGSWLKNKDWYTLVLFSLTWDFGPRCMNCNKKNSY